MFIILKAKYCFVNPPLRNLILCPMIMIKSFLIVQTDEPGKCMHHLDYDAFHKDLFYLMETKKELWGVAGGIRVCARTHVLGSIPVTTKKVCQGIEESQGYAAHNPSWDSGWGRE